MPNLMINIIAVVIENINILIIAVVDIIVMVVVLLQESLTTALMVYQQYASFMAPAPT